MQKLYRNLWFHRHTRYSSVLILTLHLLFIELRQRLIYIDRILPHSQAVVEITHMGYRHVAAPAAALYIVEYALAKQRKTDALFYRKHVILVLQKDDSLSPRATRQ